MSHLVAGRFRLERRIGSGSFGDVYLGEDVCSEEQVAIKVEPSVAKHPQLMLEAKVYKALAGRHGFPRLRYLGLEARRNVLVVDLLGPSLAELFRLCGRRFSFKTVAMLADQIIERLEYLHSLGYVHRDTKPENMLLGRGDKSGSVHIIDYGLCKRFRNVETGQHIEYRDGKALKGTLHYASVNALRGAEQSRRDDLEAVGYMLTYFLRGSLPWQEVPDAFTKRVQYQKLARAKASTSLQELCCGLEGERELLEYFNYCRGLGFKECPDYSYLRQLWTDALSREGYEYDLAFDWVGGTVPRRADSLDSGSSQLLGQ